MQGQAKASSRAEVATEDCGILLNSDSLHDLVGPVNQMRSMADLILKRHRLQVDAETQALFGFLQASSDKLEKLLTGIRTYMRIVGQQPMPYRHFNAGAALDGALSTIQDSIDSSEAQVTRDRLPEVYGDPSQIGYAFACLIANSIKFRAERRPEIHVSAAPEEKGWRFSVKDNGIGIEPKNCERIFAVFKRIHNEGYPGAGVGLAIARRVLEKHGGRIWAESQLGQGATFFFILPDGGEEGAAQWRGDC
jgi:chemotaxis family two-component system sensor kinase Cph1